jgi:hypothetical protein
VKESFKSLLTVLGVPLLAGACLVTAPPVLAAGSQEGDPDPWVEAFVRLRDAEAMRMLVTILKGEMPDAGTAWFGPSQSKYTWAWLAERHGVGPDGSIPKEKFNGPTELFDRLDRNHDGKLAADDFDWSDNSPYWRQAGLATGLFRRADSDSNGRVTAEEWAALFKRAAGAKGYVTQDDLRGMLFPPQPPRPAGPPPDMPSRLTLLTGLLYGEIGSIAEGPAVGQAAPPFTLKTQDTGKEVSLSDFKGKPVVLIFGSFT